jgi:hypothetical protein
MDKNGLLNGQWTMDRDKNGHDGLNGQEWTAEWTMDNGQWTMDDGRWTMDDGRWTMDRGYVPFRANPNIADPTDPTDLLDPSDPTDPTDLLDPSDPTDPTDLLDPSDPTDPTDLLSVSRPCKVRVGCGRQPTLNLFVPFVVKKILNATCRVSVAGCVLPGRDAR